MVEKSNLTRLMHDLGCCGEPGLLVLFIRPVLGSLCVQLAAGYVLEARMSGVSVCWCALNAELEIETRISYMNAVLVR